MKPAFKVGMSRGHLKFAADELEDWKCASCNVEFTRE